MFSQQSQQEVEKRTDIRELLKPILEEFRERRVKQVKDEINQCIGELKANKMNLHAFTGLKRQFIKRFTTPGIIYASEVQIVEIDDELVKKVERSAKFQATSDFEKYAKKIEHKISEKLPKSVVISLSLEGDLWRQSCLKVTTASERSIQFWTKTIVNRTRYGDMFFQFPTRVHKEEIEK